MVAATAGSLASGSFSDWVDRLGATPPFGPDDRLGTVGRIGPDARRAAAAAVETGDAVTLDRLLRPDRHRRREEAGVRFDVSTHFDPSTGWSSDSVQFDCHGFYQTHVDGLNHLSRHGTFYNGRTWDDPDLSTVADLAGHPIFTRALIADIPGVRGTEWVDPEQPVTGDDLDAALDGIAVQPGDAVLLSMGRHAWEADGGGFPPSGQPWPEGSPRPGAGESVARWIADHPVSLLAWDLHDAIHPDHADAAVHQLLWAIGLCIVDNCDFGRLAEHVRRTGRRTAALTLMPIGVPRGTGCPVTPLVVF